MAEQVDGRQEGSPLIGAVEKTADQGEFAHQIEPYRREILLHCYRMLGSMHDAEDVTQETLLRAWSRRDSFEGRAPLRAWLYKIATNACLDALKRRARRLLPQTARPAADPRAPAEPPIVEPIWIEPYPDGEIPDFEVGPEARYAARETVRLAFLAALQTLSPRQRAVLILRDVLGFRASEVADLLELTASSVNSLLHRARTAMAKHYHSAGPEAVQRMSSADPRGELLQRYVRAWETADVQGLIALLKEDARLAMPPTPSWYRGRDAIAAFVGAMFASGPQKPWRLLPTRANGQPAFAVYQRNEAGAYDAVGIQVLTFEGSALADITTFMDPRIVARFGLPAQLSA